MGIISIDSILYISRSISMGKQTEALYLDHHDWLVSLLYRRLGNQPDAADLAQDAFLRLLKRPRVFDGFEGARAYLSTMASGMCADLWRRREIERAYLETLAAQPELIYPSAEQQAAVIQALYEVDSLLNRLPVKAAQVFILAVIEGHTDKQVAKRLGISDRMVRKYVAKVMLECLSLGLHPDG